MTRGSTLIYHLKHFFRSRMHFRKPPLQMLPADGTRSLKI